MVSDAPIIGRCFDRWFDCVLRGRLGADYRHPWEELSLTVKARASFGPLVGLKRNSPASARRAAVAGDVAPISDMLDTASPALQRSK